MVYNWLTYSQPYPHALNEGRVQWRSDTINIQDDTQHLMLKRLYFRDIPLCITLLHTKRYMLFKDWLIIPLFDHPIAIVVFDLAFIFIAFCIVNIYLSLSLSTFIIFKNVLLRKVIIYSFKSCLFLFMADWFFCFIISGRKLQCDNNEFIK